MIFPEIKWKCAIIHGEFLLQVNGEVKGMGIRLLEQQREIHNKPEMSDLSRTGRSVYLFAKRIFDLILAFVGVVLCIIPVGVIALLIKIDSPGPVFYLHHRIGKNGKDLYLLKFRSMHLNAEEMINELSPEQREEWKQNFKLEDDPRVTRIGRFLRRSSLDELPQLINILKGELSIVGPRPVVQEELEKYGENKEKFLSVIPGLTGYWQAYARSNCSYEQRMEMELSYIENANFWWDIKIIFATFGAVFTGRGAR